jgi:hypothetical protein
MYAPTKNKGPPNTKDNRHSDPMMGGNNGSTHSMPVHNNKHAPMNNNASDHSPRPNRKSANDASTRNYSHSPRPNRKSANTAVPASPRPRKSANDAVPASPRGRRSANGDNSNDSNGIRSPRPGTKRASQPKGGVGGGGDQFHDPYSVFDRVMKEEFGDEYKATDESSWKGSSGILGFGKNIKLKAKALNNNNNNNPNAVVSMSTSTKQETRKDGTVEVKTVTKIVRADGSAEKVLQASVGDKEAAKNIPKDKTVTIAREKSKKKK